MFSDALPSIWRACSPTAMVCFVRLESATTEGSRSTTPCPRTQTMMLDVPRSIPKSGLNPHIFPSCLDSLATRRWLPRLGALAEQGNVWLVRE
jgi:hypothetical protein